MLPCRPGRALLHVSISYKEMEPTTSPELPKGIGRRQGNSISITAQDVTFGAITEGDTGNWAHLRIHGALHEVVKADLQVLRWLVAGKVQQEHTPTRAQEVPNAIDNCQHCCNCRHLSTQHSGSQQRFDDQNSPAWVKDWSPTVKDMSS